MAAVEASALAFGPEGLGKSSDAFSRDCRFGARLSAGWPPTFSSCRWGWSRPVPGGSILRSPTTAVVGRLVSVQEVVVGPGLGMRVAPGTTGAISSGKSGLFDFARNFVSPGTRRLALVAGSLLRSKGIRVGLMGPEPRRPEALSCCGAPRSLGGVVVRRIFPRKKK